MFSYAVSGMAASNPPWIYWTPPFQYMTWCCSYSANLNGGKEMHITTATALLQQVLHVSWYSGTRMPIWPSDPFPAGHAFLSFPPHDLKFAYCACLDLMTGVDFVSDIIWFSFPWFLFLCHGWAGCIIELFQFCLFIEWKHDQKVNKVILHQWMT